MSRLVFCETNYLKTEEMVEQEHGFFGSKKMTKNSDGFYEKLLETILPLFKEKQYSFSSPVQDDNSLVFFINDNAKTIGFFYKCAERFVCPLERFVSIGLESTGYFKNSYLIQFPTDFVVTLKYLNNNGEESDIKINLTAKREYIRKSSWLFMFSSKYEELEAMISDRTTKYLSIIEKRIKENKAKLDLNLPDININVIEQDAIEKAAVYEKALNQCIKEYIKK